ncbi:hypothetical protein FQZ97_1205650 [compost metagenome]
MKRFSFKKGYDQLPAGKVQEVRGELFKALGINRNSRKAFLMRMRGETEPKVTEAEAIEKIFRAEGITDIWGD